jgi:hypothetical protein
MALATTTDLGSVVYSYTKQGLSEQQIVLNKQNDFCTILQSQLRILSFWYYFKHMTPIIGNYASIFNLLALPTKAMILCFHSL